MKTAVLLLIASMAMPPLAWADNLVPAGQGEEAKPGFGYNTDTQKFVGRCLKGIEERHGRAEANLSFAQTVSQQEMKSELGFEAGGRFTYGAAKIGISAKFAKGQQESGYSIVAVYTGSYKFKNIILNFADPTNPNAKPEEIERERLSAVGLSVRKDPIKWAETCGEEYVQQIERGAKLFYSIRIDFSSREEKELFETSFSYDSSYASVAAHLKNAKQNFSKNTKVTIGALQIGGDVRRVTELFNGENTPGGAVGFVKCSFGDFAACDGVMASAWEYATKEFKNQLDTTNPDQPSDSGPAYIVYHTKKYSTAGIYSEFSSVLTQDILGKRKEVEAAFDREMKMGGEIDFRLNSKTVILSPRQQKILKDADLVSRKNKVILVKAAETCYNQPRDCSLAANGALTGPNKIQPISEEVLVINPETFRQYCEFASSVMCSPEVRNSVAGMIQAAKKTDENAFKSVADMPVDECLVSHMVFGRNSVLDFSGQKISTLAPLAEYTNFTKVNFSNNEIEDLSPIKDWRNLEDINLHENRVRDAGILGSLLNLRKVRISNNRLRTIDTLTTLPKLERIDARNNYPDVNCKQFKQDTTCLSASVRTDANFIPVNTIVPGMLFMPVVASMADGKVFITSLSQIGTIFDSSSNTYAVPRSTGNWSYGQSAVTLKDGKILVTGGWGTDKRVVEFDPATGNSRELAPLKISRAEHISTLLQDGRVLLSGGWEGGVTWTGANASYTAEIFDPATGKTQLTPKMHAPRAWHTATLLKSGKILITGGFSLAASLATIEVFDPATGQFEIGKKSMSEGRGGHTATLLDDGNVLIAGGYANEGSATKSAALDSAEIFDPDMMAFKKVAEPLNRKRGHHSAVRLANGKVLLAGGSEILYAPDAPMPGADPSAVNKAELFDPVENSFSEIPAPMYIARARHASHEIKPGLVLVVGGIHHAAAKNSEVFTYTDTQVNNLNLR
jgi:hypothetical protein